MRNGHSGEEPNETSGLNAMWYYGQDPGPEKSIT